MKIYDVTGVIVSDDELVTALFDGREGEESIMLIKPVQKDGKIILETSQPDGIERYYWLNKFGLLPDAELNSMYKQQSAERERREIYDKLKKEFESKGG